MNIYIFLDNPGVPGCLEVSGGGDRGDRGGGVCCPGVRGVREFRGCRKLGNSGFLDFWIDWEEQNIRTYRLIGIAGNYIL